MNQKNWSVEKHLKEIEKKKEMSSRNVTMLKYVFVMCLNHHKPFAFKNLMIRGVLHFTLRFAFCCVLHRCENQDIRC